jgi:hypothetical protein
MDERSPGSARTRRTAPRQRQAPATEHIEENPTAGDAAQYLPGMARYLTDPAIEAEIQAFIATAPPLPEDKRARLARLLRTKQCRHQDSRHGRPTSSRPNTSKDRNPR